ncbi:protein phosphatase 2C domain-containing protein [Haliangium sp.]|uniref:PP2C family serine/threonine-protein phosphatase n=1 Tax=Haliangium sp. TaxID=2663208 RepID=UPI003D0E49EA
MRLIAWGESDPGQTRSHNEDSFLVAESLGLFAVADGLGGHRGGETASRMATEVLARTVAASIDDLAEAATQFEQTRQRSGRVLEDVTPMEHRAGWRERLGRAPTAPLGVPVIDAPAIAVLRAGAQQAGREIYEAARADPGLSGMGTTLTAMLYHDGVMHVIHAGDSRAYLLREQALRQLTEDHSWIAEQVRSGRMSEGEAMSSGLRNVITRSVGFDHEVELDTFEVTVAAGDRFLLCSDGLTNHVGDEELQAMLSANETAEVPGALIALANQRGGEDNITVVVVQAQ